MPFLDARHLYRQVDRAHRDVLPEHIELDHPDDHAVEQLAWLAGTSPATWRWLSRIGADHRREVKGLAACALRSRRRELAAGVFQAADRPGRHQKRLRERCASPTGVVVGNADGSRPSLPAGPGSSSGGAQRCSELLF